MKKNKINTIPKLKKKNGIWAVLTASVFSLVLGVGITGCLVHYVPAISSFIVNKEVTKDSNEYKTQVITLTNELQLVKNDLQNAQNINASNLELLKTKQIELTEKTTLIASLQIENAENVGKISAYETQINNLKEQLKIEQDKTNSDAQIILSLNNQISTLQTEKQNLEAINSSNNNTINLLNSQVLNLNNTVTELTNTINKNQTTIQQLNSRINELQESIKYYELLIGAYDFEGKTVVTFQYNGSVHALQVIDKGTKPTTTIPADTDYIKFNYWMLNGEQVDIETLKPTENITLVANLTYYYDVKYFNGEEIYNSTIVEKGQTVANLQLSNTAQNKRHIGWSLDGVNIVDLSQMVITENTNLYAVWENAKEVKFMNGTEQIGEIQTVFEFDNVTVPTINKNGYNFVGWTIDGTNIIDLTNYELTNNVVFKAKFELITYTLTFISDDTNYATFNYSIENNVINVTEPTKDGYNFDGWTLDGVNVVNINETSITSNTTFIAKFSKIELSSCLWSEISEYSTTGQAQSLFNVGDEKDFTLSTGETLTAVILDFDAENHIIFGLKNPMSTKYKLSDFMPKYIYGRNYDYFDGKIRGEVLSAVYSQMPAELQAIIKTVNKTIDATSTAPQTKGCKLWLFNYTDFIVPKYGDTSDKRLAYYKENSILFETTQGEPVDCVGTIEYAPAMSATYCVLKNGTLTNSDDYDSSKVGLLFGFKI